MDLLAALKLLKAFPACNLRIFKQFSGFPDPFSQESESGYVVFADSSLVDEACYCEFRDYASTCGLTITPFGQHLMISDQ
jgi:hypothetical protein